MIECKKGEEADPTMERSTTIIEEKETDDKLHQQFNHLEQEWASIKQPKPRTLRNKISTDSITIVKALKLLDNSPRNLMSSLQGAAWKVRNNDLAVEEIIRERRAAIESGKLKGRRLFETQVGFGGSEEICSGLNGLVQESEVRSVFSYDSTDDNEPNNSVLSPQRCSCSSSSSSSSSLCGENLEKEVMAIIACDVDGERGRWKIIKVFFVISLVVCAVSTIISTRGSGEFGVEKVILVPT